jgi:molecular chaperone HtpG
MKDKEGRQDDVKMICQHIFDLAMISHAQLEPEAMTRFIERSNLILQKVAGI